VAALCAVLGTGCAKPDTEDSSKLKAEIESVRAELTKAQAECTAVREELEKLKADVRARPAVAPEVERASLPGRFAAAMALTTPSQKQAAMAKLAGDAAELGDAETTRGCIDQLSSPSQKQDVTYQSALRLARCNKAEEARALASTLTSPSQRQKALSKIANGDYRD
jgi:hypothetical protein